MGVLNLMPWAGPTMRAAAVLGMEASSFWHTILPIQICGVVLAFAVAFVNGVLEKKRGAGLNGKLTEIEGNVETEAGAETEKQNEFARPKLFLFNILLTVAVIALLILDIYRIDNFPDFDIVAV